MLKGKIMHGKNFYWPVRLLSSLIILLMFIAIAYAAYTAVKYWNGIGV